jgi:hypothetical protein
LNTKTKVVYLLIYKEFLDVQTKTVAASDLSYSEESLRALFLAALAHDLLTPLLFCFRDNLFHWFITLEYRALSFPFTP